jgi:RNA polymerase sigma-70 factor (ECF subfamily)
MVSSVVCESFSGGRIMLSSVGCDNRTQDIDNRSNEELLNRTRLGDQGAFTELIQRHHATCINIATCILRDREEAKDQVQKAYWKAHVHLDQCRGGEGIAAWLLSIVKTECLMLLRVKRRMPLLYIDDNRRDGRRRELRGSNPDPEDELMRRELITVARREVYLLPCLLQNVLVLRDLEELSITEVAERLRISVPAAKSRLLRARQELRKRLIAYYRNGSTSRKYPNPATRAVHQERVESRCG